MRGQIREKKVMIGTKLMTQKTYFLEGKEVTQAEFEAQFPDKPMGMFAAPSTSAWPIRSEAAAVHPKQRQEAMDSAKAKGVPTYFDRHGRPVFRSLRHQRDYLKQYGFHNNDDNATGPSTTTKPSLPEYV